MNAEALKEAIRQELPHFLRTDPDLRAYILELTRREYAGREETQDRFYEMLAELRRDREEQTQKWQEQNRKWDEHQAEQREEFAKLYEQLNRDREEQTRKWDEQNRKWDEHQAEQREEFAKLYEQLNHDREEQARKWETNREELRQLHQDAKERQAEQNRKWQANQEELRQLHQDAKERQAEQNRKWEANQEELRQLHQEIMAQTLKHDRGIGALGSRWGLQSEKAFRDALAAILEKSFNVQVLNVNEYDDQGEVFGRPDQVELDVIVHNGSLIICELKSSIDKAGMYIFERKARFYEKRHQRTATRLMVISPMIDARARKVAEQLGIETYGDSILVEAL